MSKYGKAYVTGCRYCDNWGPEDGCWPCIRFRPIRLLRKLFSRLH